MTGKEQVRKWIAEAEPDDLREALRFLDRVSLEAAVLLYQWSGDPKGTAKRY